MQLSVVGDSVAPDPPFPPDTRAKGWRFELDHERIEQSDTWAIAPAEVRPWLLMLWMTAWRQVPCGSLPDSDELIAARIGMPAMQYAVLRSVLLRGWRRHSDGRLYHPVLIEQVNAMLQYRRKEAGRVRAWREQKSQDDDVTRNQRMSTTPEPEPELEPRERLSTPTGVEGIAAAEAPANPQPIRPAERLPDCPAQRLVDLYHERLPLLPQCFVLNETRRGYLRARWREYAERHKWRSEQEGLEFFADYFAHVSKSKFLTGRTKGREDRPPFVADLEWLFRPMNFAKVVEGKYHQ